MYSKEELAMLCCIADSCASVVIALVSKECYHCKNGLHPENQLEHFCLNIDLDQSCDWFYDRALQHIKEKQSHVVQIFELCSHKMQLERSGISTNSLFEKMVSIPKYLIALENIVRADYMDEYEEQILQMLDIASDAAFGRYHDLIEGMK